MEFLSLWVKILIVLGLALFGVWAYMCDLWTERDPKKLTNIIGGIMLASLCFFKVFLLATIIFSVIYLIVVNI